MTYIIALTGGICSGKSTVSNFFSKLPGISIVDSDLISRKVTQPNSRALSAIVKYFGCNILLSNGTLDRSKLKQHIFLNTKDRKWIEKLLHPIIQKETQNKINQLLRKSIFVLWVVPLLIENNLQKNANRILVVDINQHIQLSRIIKRDHINKQYAENILLSQVSRQTRLDYAHDVIDNNHNIENIKLQILNLYRFYTNIKIIHNT